MKVNVVRVVQRVEHNNFGCEIPSRVEQDGASVCNADPVVEDLKRVIDSLTDELGRYVDDAQAAQKKIADLEAQRDAARLQLDATKQALDKAQKTNEVLLEECRKLNERLDAALNSSTTKQDVSSCEDSKISNKVVAYLII